MAGVKVGEGDQERTAIFKSKKSDLHERDNKSPKSGNKKPGSKLLHDKELFNKPLLGKGDLPSKDNPQNGSGKRRREWIRLVSMPKDHEDSKSFDLNHVKERLMFWEGERQITGAVEVETWVGSRHDECFRVAGVPLLKKRDVEAEKVRPTAAFPKSDRTLFADCPPVITVYYIHHKRTVLPKLVPVQTDYPDCCPYIVQYIAIYILLDATQY